MAITKETLKTFRDRFIDEVNGCENDDEARSAFDRALASVLLDQLDGTAPEPKKRTYTRKPKAGALDFPPNEK